MSAYTLRWNRRSVAYFLVVFDVVLQDDAVGLVGFVPLQDHAVLTGVLLADG